jgi:hypothetical protein
LIRFFLDTAELLRNGLFQVGRKTRSNDRRVVGGRQFDRRELGTLGGRSGGGASTFVLPQVTNAVVTSRPRRREPEISGGPSPKMAGA